MLAAHSPVAVAGAARTSSRCYARSGNGTRPWPPRRRRSHLTPSNTTDLYVRPGSFLLPKGMGNDTESIRVGWWRPPVARARRVTLPVLHAQQISDARIHGADASVRRPEAWLRRQLPERSRGRRPRRQWPTTGRVVPLTFDDAVKAALDHNLDIAVQRLNPEINDISYAQPEGSIYLPALTSQLGDAGSGQRLGHDDRRRGRRARQRRHGADPDGQRRHHARTCCGAAVQLLRHPEQQQGARPSPANHVLINPSYCNTN